MSTPFSELASFVWSIADTLRGSFKPHQYGDVILPFVVLRRMDCVLEPTKAAVLGEFKRRQALGEREREPYLLKKANAQFYNVYEASLPALLSEPDALADNLRAYVRGFSPSTRDIFDNLKFDEVVTDLAKAKLLFAITQKFVQIDLHPDDVSNEQMGQVFEELIRRFAESSNETAGDHFTPREVVQLMVRLLLEPDAELLRRESVIKTIYDPTCGTGAMLSVAEAHVRAENPDAVFRVYGQEINKQSHAICKADMLFKGQDLNRIACENTLTADAFPDEKFDYMLSNPPFGVDWKEFQGQMRVKFAATFSNTI